jgi:DNA polymerase I-like protein with 3'-5' exonuclease and polymerase domains
MRIQVHDELVFVAPRKYANLCIAIIKRMMANALPEPLIVPLFAEADQGSTYAEAK